VRQVFLRRLLLVNPWFWVAGGVLLLNMLLLLWGVFSSSSLLGDRPKRSLSVGIRADLIQVSTPWVEQSLHTAPQAAVKIDLKHSKESLEKAIGVASAKVEQEVIEPKQCKLWGPLLPNEWVRVADALAQWTGEVEKQERQVPVGYIVYLPKDKVVGNTLTDLQRKGVTELFVINSQGPLQGTIALGSFRDLDRATVQKDQLIAKGVQGVSIRERLGPTRTFYQLLGNSKQMDELDGIFQLNRRGDLKGC
jgi:hypothetical protein